MLVHHPPHTISYTFLSSFVSPAFLDLENNAFTGTIPPELSGLGDITSLHLGRNDFGQSPIPEEIYSMETLQELELFACNISGPISPSIANLTELTLLRLEVNSLTGGIPEDVAELVNMVEMSFGGNFLTGPLPNITTLVNLGE